MTSRRGGRNGRAGLAGLCLTVSLLAVGCQGRGWPWETSREATTAKLLSGPLPPDEGYDDYISALPSRDDLHGDGLRFVANPTFSLGRYALAVARPRSDGELNGTLHLYIAAAGGDPVRRVRRFHVGAADYGRFSAEIDRALGELHDESAQCLDGTLFAYERVVGAHIKAATNAGAGCGEQLQQMGEIILRHVRAWTSAEDLPDSSDWSLLSRPRPDEPPARE